MDKCPKCGMAVQLIATEPLCSNCGILDGSQLVIKKARSMCLKPRLFAAGVIFLLISSFITLMRLNPGFIKNHPNLETILFYLILVFGMGVNIYTSIILKKNFPHVGFDNI